MTVQPPVSIEALVRRWERDEAVDPFATAVAEPALARALAALGWPPPGPAAGPEELAGFVADMIDACVYGHRDPAILCRDVADLLRHAVPPRGGLLPTLAEFEPLASALVHAYVTGEPGAPPT